MKMPLKSLNSCQKLFGKKGVFLHDIFRAICSKFSKNLQVLANNLSNILLSELKIWSDISQSISLQKNTQIADILSLFLLPKCKRKNQKAWKFSVHLLDICLTFAK
jgi:hypothetical protein